MDQLKPEIASSKLLMNQVRRNLDLAEKNIEWATTEEMSYYLRHAAERAVQLSRLLCDIHASISPKAVTK